jgi:hypothetical protein
MVVELAPSRHRQVPGEMTKSEKRNGDPASRRIAVHCSEMSIARLSAIQLRWQVARHFHARLGLVNRRLLPLTHLKLSF